MEDYEPPAGSTVEKGKKKKKKKDPNAPKRGNSSFMFFSNEVRAKVKAENPEFKFGDIVSSGSCALLCVSVLGSLTQLSDVSGKENWFHVQGTNAR